MDDNKELKQPIIFNNKPNKDNENLKNPIIIDTPDKSPEEKMYIILYNIEEDSLEEDMRNIFSICIGRTEAYNDIKNKLQSGMIINIHKSKILVETKQTETSTGNRKYYLLPYLECISVYAFCINVYEYFMDDDFDIEEYNTSGPEDPEEELKSHPMYMTAEQRRYRELLEESFELKKLGIEPSDITSHNI